MTVPGVFVLFCVVHVSPGEEEAVGSAWQCGRRLPAENRTSCGLCRVRGDVFFAGKVSLAVPHPARTLLIFFNSFFFLMIKKKMSVYLGG